MRTCLNTTHSRSNIDSEWIRQRQPEEGSEEIGQGLKMFPEWNNEDMGEGLKMFPEWNNEDMGGSLGEASHGRHHDHFDSGV
jgi:hypothetical protein